MRQRSEGTLHPAGAVSVIAQSLGVTEMKLSETETSYYEIFNLNDLDRVADVIGKAFTNSDPMAVTQLLSVKEFADYVKSIGEWMEKQQLTVVTKDKSTDEVAGVVIAGDFASDFSLTPENSQHLSDKLEPIMELLESLEAQYIQGRQIQAGEYLYIHMLAVSPKYQRRKIAQNSIQVCLNHAIEKGFTCAFTEAANSVSQHVFGKLGFVPRHQVSYQQFTYQGQKVFASIEGDTGTILMDKSIN